jgi:hypothetical protein
VIIRTVSLVQVLLACALSIAMNCGAARIGGAFQDDFALPGGTLGPLGSAAGLFDAPSLGWAVVCIVGNFVFYAVLCWILLKLVNRMSQGGGSVSDVPSNTSLERTRER